MIIKPQDQVNLAQWRERLGKSQTDMATLLGVPRVTYAKWENASREAPAVARRLFQVMQTIEWLAPQVFASLNVVPEKGTPGKRKSDFGDAQS